MDGNAYRRTVNRDGNMESQVYGSRHGSCSNRSSSHSNRSHGSKSINLKALKNTSLTCAKSLTNKLISLSNSGLQAASSAINTYKENAAAHARKVASANPNSFLRIAERISSTNDPIASHRELVAVIEHILIWDHPPIQLTLERDRYGIPTPDSMKNVQLINMPLLEKILNYVEGRRDCCLFIIKFTTWRMRTTTHPEEVILSLEFLQHCMERFGGFFLSLMTKSCMRRLRRLLSITKLTSSIAGGVKKQLTKLIIGSSNVHPGVSTDVRMHVVKAKVLYMVQLWHDVFLLDQGMYPVFFHGYREMRERGIKFPQVDPSEHSKINMSPVLPKSQFVIGGNIVLPLTPEELDTILTTVQNINNLPPGPEYDEAINKLKGSKERIVASINILAERRSLMPDQHQYEEVLRKMLVLNDCVGSHLSLRAPGCQYSSQLLSRMEVTPPDKATPSPQKEEPQESNKLNLLELDSSSDSDNNEEFDTFFGSGPAQPERKKSEDDYEKFFAEFGVFGTAERKADKPGSTSSEQRRNYASELDSLDFGNPIQEPSLSIPVSTSSKSLRSESMYSSDTYKQTRLDYDSFSATESEYLSGRRTENDSMTPSPSANSPRGELPTSKVEEKPAVAEKEGERRQIACNDGADQMAKKTLSELMKDLDNMEHDFSHMSVTRF